MTRLLHTSGLLAALAAVSVSVWRDQGLWVALKRALFSYLGFFIVSALLVLLFRWGVLAESGKEQPAKSRGAKQE